MTHAGGRPSKYNRKMPTKVWEYLDSCVDEYVKIKGARTKRLQVKLPSVEGLAMHLKVSKPTVYEWKKRYPEFSYAMEIVDVAQAERLLNGGMSGMYSSRISGMILSAKHGYVPKSESREVENWDELMSEAEKIDADSTTGQDAH